MEASTQPTDAARLAALFSEAVAIMAHLRSPEGCPWDREQTFDSIRKYTLEETYEVFDAIERRHWSDLTEELGDLLLQILFYSQMAAEAGYFSIGDVIEHLNRKLIRRHPHVFGDEAAAAAGNAAQVDSNATVPSQVLRNWELIKQAEKAAKQGNDSEMPHSRLSGIPRSLPALMEASKLGSRAAKVGFDWKDNRGLFDKLTEEISELQEAMTAGAPLRNLSAGGEEPGTSTRAAIQGEVGDLLFTVVNLARHLRVDPEMALRQSNAKFRNRFQAMESSAAGPLEELSQEELEALWSQAKQKESIE
jgi:nucleoside triphosphate diphosphatase